ncbi:RNA polymerase sigma factor [Cytobacillus sp. IB215665]|uniref:RNA polymerase sigma factor n=1 Tax=Cytobacillus sp. IB215665 TaxID=3097357 RepID=UPI002A147F09|nr:RNA polymerase sigma factor [Cytobacillus sp. IB215665]MDX8365675.1 RNA polymerase sigma factor [Cytobacillus sp. IB215665]
MKQEKIKNDVLHLYDVYSSRILKFIFVLTKDYHTAEDLTQDTFIKVNNSYDQLKDKEKVETWLFQIAHNLSMDHIRRKRFSVLDHIVPTLQKKESSPSLDKVIIINESVRELYDVISKLKPTYREIIILRKIEELSIKETSEVLGWSESKVTTTLSRAMKLLHKELEKGGHIYEQSS